MGIQPIHWKLRSVSVFFMRYGFARSMIELPADGNLYSDSNEKTGRLRAAAGESKSDDDTRHSSGTKCNETLAHEVMSDRTRLQKAHARSLLDILTRVRAIYVKGSFWYARF
jgi:hypothetical protein